MSFDKKQYTYHHKKFEAISFFKFVKKRQNKFINLHVRLLVEQWGLYKNFKRIVLHFRAVILMSFDKKQYTYHHKKFEAISFIKVCKKRQNEFINLHVHVT